MQIAKQGWAGKVFFRRRGGQGKARSLWGGAEQRSKSVGQGTYCVYKLIEIICYSRGNLDLHCIKWRNILNIQNHDRNYDHYHCHIVPLWVSWIGMIWECDLYFATPLPAAFTILGGGAMQGVSRSSAGPGRPSLMQKRLDQCKTGNRQAKF